MRASIVVLALFTLASGARAATAPEEFIPAEPAARAAISFDARGFLIGGKREFLASGSLHYARVPRGLWRDRLLRMKRAGLNTVQTYAFWNWHEPTPGKFDFSGERDLGAFLDLVHELGMFAVLRVGPYVCAEWDSGGFPVWLRFVPGLRVRDDNAPFLAAVDRWFDHLLPLVAERQIHKGGAVILVQLENEHPKALKVDSSDRYFSHLIDRARARGVEVPLLLNEMHHGHDPAGNTPWDGTKRRSPWHTTELWTGWFSLYGAQGPRDHLKNVRAPWKAIAFGAGGFNHYIYVGGSNLGAFNDNDTAASYDFGAPIGQAGDLRPLFYDLRRSATFARSFADVIAAGEARTPSAPELVGDKRLSVWVRQSPRGKLSFVDNPTTTAITTSVARGGSLTVAPGEIVTVAENVTLDDATVLEWAPVRIFGVARHRDGDTLVVHGPAGQPFELRLKGRESATVKGTFSNTPMVQMVGRWRVLAVDTPTVDRTFFVDGPAGTTIVMGAPFVGDASFAGERLATTTLEWPAGPARRETITVYEGAQVRSESVAVAAAAVASPALRVRWRAATDEAAPSYADGSWRASAAPEAMGADGDPGPYAWYRTRFTVGSAGRYELLFDDARDWLRVFVDGRPTTPLMASQRSAVLPRVVPVTLAAGEHVLAVLTAHHGRPKLFFYVGPIDRVDAKGLAGPVWLRTGARGAIANVGGWRMRVGSGDEREQAEVAAGRGGGWQDGVIGRDVFDDRRGFLWFRTELDPASLPGAAERRLVFSGVDDRATTFLNGVRLGQNLGWTLFYEYGLDRAWRADGPNVLTVLVENIENKAGFLTGAPDLVTLDRGQPAPGHASPLANWRMRGGAGDPARAGAAWRASRERPPGGPDAVPIWVEAKLTRPKATNGARPILRLHTEGLSTGFVWLNGHELGRYPDKVAAPGVYLPESWWRDGDNTIVLLDEEGRLTAPPVVMMERPESRVTSSLPTRSLARR